MLRKIWNLAKIVGGWIAKIYQPVCTGLQTLAICAGALLLLLTMRQIQGTTIQSSYQTSKELMLKAMEDPDLMPLLPGYKKLSNDDLKRKYLLILLVNHYYTMFRQHDLGNLPDRYWIDIDKDAKIFFKQFIPQKNWNSMKTGYNQDFVTYVNLIYSEKNQP